MVYSTLSFSSVLPPPPPRSCLNDPLEQKEGQRREILLLVWPKHTLLETLLKTLNFIDYSVMGAEKVTHMIDISKANALYSITSMNFH